LNLCVDLRGIVLAAIGTFFMVHYLAYITLEVDGKRVSDYIPFTKYLDIMIRSVSYEFRVTRAAMRVGSTGELGEFGYVVAVLQIVGFAIGGFVLYMYLTSKPHCEKCSQYLPGKGKQLRYTGDAGGMRAATSQIFQHVSNRNVAAAIESQAAFGNLKPQKDNHLRSMFEVRYCKKCQQHWVKFSVAKRGRDWDEIPETTIASFTDEPVSLSTGRTFESVHPPVAPVAPPPRASEVKCWRCHAVLDVTNENAGKDVRCPSCGERQRMPV
jgi:hypothetical protein